MGYGYDSEKYELEFIVIKPKYYNGMVNHL